MKTNYVYQSDKGNRGQTTAKFRVTISKRQTNTTTQIQDEILLFIQISWKSKL